MRRRNAADERQVIVSLTDEGRALRGETRILTETLDERSGMSVEALVDLNDKVKALRDAFRGSSSAA